MDIDLEDGTVTVEFDDNTADQLHLASFEVPGRFELGEVSKQDTFEVELTTEPEGSLTVDIPTPDEYSDG